MSQTISPTRKSLVLVVGAGASKEVKLPIGNELRAAISSNLNFHVEGMHVVGGNDKILHAIHQLAQQSNDQRGNINPYIDAARRIRIAMPIAPSIDNFIDSHRSDDRLAQCGKLAIAACILKAEKASSLKVDRSNIFNKIKFADVEDTWFNLFCRLIVQSCQQEEVVERLKKISIISFNYDRCLEHFLHDALQVYYPITAGEATEILRNLSIFHPYGKVGPLPWMDSSSGIPYGGEPTPQQLISLANQIRTFTEGTDETSSDVLDIRSTLRMAKRVAFLGFAFHPLNLEVLFGSARGSNVFLDSRVYGTALGLSESDTKVIADEVARQGGYDARNITLNRNLTAAQLFTEYSRSLSLY